MAEVSTPFKPSFEIPKKKITSNGKDDKQAKEDIGDKQVLRDKDDRQVVELSTAEAKAEPVGLNMAGKKSKKRKVRSASSGSIGVKKAKQIKDPNAPKRPATAFMIFSAEEKNKDDLRHLSFGEKGECPCLSFFLK